MRMQEHHDLADDLLVRPAGGDLLRPTSSDAADLLQARRRLLDDIEDASAEGLDQAAGVDGADALDHARAEVALDAVSVFGGAILTNTARNCRPCSRSVTQLPEAEAYSPGDSWARGRSG